MHSLARLTSASILVLLLGSTAVAVPTASLPVRTRNTALFSALIAFGDSFSDNGSGAWVVSNRTWPADPHYFDGRFSNGPVWVEYLARNLSIPLLDYATGGATTSNALVKGFTGPGSSIPVPSVDEQVSLFLNDSDRTSSRRTNASLSAPLFALLGGANDPLFDPTVTAAQSFRALMASSARLAVKFPTARFVFLNYPDLSRIPYAFYADAQTKRRLRTFSAELDALYRDAILQDHEERWDAAGSTYVDVMSLFEEFDYYGAPEEYGFAPLGAYGSCLTGVYGETPNVTVCEEPNGTVFWDEYHPTTHAHSWLARLVLDSLRA